MFVYYSCGFIALILAILLMMSYRSVLTTRETPKRKYLTQRDTNRLIYTAIIIWVIFFTCYILSCCLYYTSYYQKLDNLYRANFILPILSLCIFLLGFLPCAFKHRKKYTNYFHRHIKSKPAIFFLEFSMFGLLALSAVYVIRGMIPAAEVPIFPNIPTATILW